ncbi:MAG: methyltransferase domain-containing protein [Clostridiales bacterium]|nr:methyltransferase domain-containing protein [Clostridiales bacterium]
MTNPLCDPYLILVKVYSGGKYLKQAISDTPTEPLNRAKTIKTVYGVLDKDYYLNYIISENTKTLPKLSVRIILKIALYMLEFLGKHDYMVVDSAVELTKKLGKSGAAGFVNSFLRSYKIPVFDENCANGMAIKWSTPVWLVKKLRRSYKAEAEKILTFQPLGNSVRFVRGEERYLAAEHIHTPFKGVYIFPNFVRDEGFFAGDYTFQSVGSVAISAAISPVERVLDACAAPGGKSVALAEKCGEVVSCEVHEHRTQLIRDYARRMGVNNLTAVTCDSSHFNAEFENAFDAVLCDVPCSGTGVMGENPDIKLNRKEEDIAALNKVQAAILSNCARYLKSGGTLYYSTCSVLPEENDSIAVGFLQSHPDFSLSIPTSPLEHRMTDYGLQFLPHISLGAGFYLTAFTKK